MSATRSMPPTRTSPARRTYGAPGEPKNGTDVRSRTAPAEGNPKRSPLPGSSSETAEKKMRLRSPTGLVRPPRAVLRVRRDSYMCNSPGKRIARGFESRTPRCTRGAVGFILGGLRAGAERQSKLSATAYDPSATVVRCGWTAVAYPASPAFSSELGPDVGSLLWRQRSTVDRRPGSVRGRRV